MAPHDPHREEEEFVPPGWDAAKEAADPRWKGIARLMRESDRPSMPPPALFEAVQMDIRRQLDREGLLRPAPPVREIGFADWLRHILLGGRIGGELVRLGAMATVGLLVGMQFAAPTATERNATSAAAPAPAEQPAAEIAAAPAERTVGGSVSKSVFDQPPHEGGGWDSPSVPVNGNSFAGPVAVSNPQGIASQALEQLQSLKLNSVMNQDERSLADVRRLEQTISSLLCEGKQPTENPRVAAVDLYRRGEDAARAGRWSEAEGYYEKAGQLVPGTSLAFMAQFQIGRIAFEHTGDYETARSAFSRCVENFPQQLIRDDYKNYLRDRIRLIFATEGENWRSLKTWQAAQASSAPADAVNQFLDVVANSTCERLAADAALRVKDIAIADGPDGVLEPENLISALRERLGKTTDPGSAQRIQFAIAEIAARRTEDQIQALADYQDALRRAPEDPFARTIQKRLQGTTTLYLYTERR